MSEPLRLIKACMSGGHVAVKGLSPRRTIGAPSLPGASNIRRAQALAFARRGWYVFPCHSVVADGCSCGDSTCDHVGKHPRINNWAEQATVDPARIMSWWKKWPDANIAIATGPSDLLVVDVDPRNGGDASLERLHALGLAPDASATYTVQTGGGGRHYYLRRNTEDLPTRKGFRRGIDVISRTGYVIAAGSSGSVGDYICLDEANPGPIPRGLYAELVRSTKSDINLLNQDDWVATKLKGAQKGERNKTASELAGHFLRRGGESREVVETIMCDFADRCVPPMEHAEVLRVVESIADRESSKREYGLMEISEPLSAVAARIATQPKRRMLIDNLIPEGTTLIHGQPRALKTLFAQECLVCIATGTVAFSLDAFTTGDPVPVWYVSNEDAERDVLTRFEGLCRGRGITQLPENLRVTIWKGLSLDTPDWHSRIIETVRRYGIQIIVFDPLRAVTTNADEGPGKFNVPADFLRQLRRETTCRSIALVHHDVKPARTGRDSRDRPQLASGGAVFAFSESPIHLERINESPAQAKATPSLFKFMPSPPSFAFTLDVDSNGEFRLLGSHDVAPTNRHDSLRKKILHCLEGQPPLSKNNIWQNVGGNKAFVLSEIDALGDEGILVNQGGGWKIADAAR